MDWVAPRLTGGLGNRLFQFACAKQYAEKRNKQLVFFLPRCGETSHGKFENIFDLFPEVPVVETAGEWNVLEEKVGSHFIHNVLEESATPLVISGYRQSWKYSIGITIEPKFQPRPDLDIKYLKDKTNLFCVHIRLGDFRVLKHHQINISKYYANAIQKIPDNVEVLLLSDEPELVKNILTIPHKIVDEKNELECLYIMSNCLKGAIVGNSTFSYWGAYLAHEKSKDHIAFYPNTMGRGLPPLQDYIPPWGITIDSTF